MPGSCGSGDHMVSAGQGASRATLGSISGLSNTEDVTRVGHMP